jgi:hypothetical protein
MESPLPVGGYQNLKTHLHNPLMDRTLDAFPTAQTSFLPGLGRKLVLFSRVRISKGDILVSIQIIVSGCAHETMERSPKQEVKVRSCQHLDLDTYFTRPEVQG